MFITDSENTLQNAETPVFAKNSTSFKEFLYDTFEIEATESAFSAIVDSTFENCVGLRSSTISLQRAGLLLATYIEDSSLVNFY